MNADKILFVMPLTVMFGFTILCVFILFVHFELGAYVASLIFAASGYYAFRVDYREYKEVKEIQNMIRWIE